METDERWKRKVSRDINRRVYRRGDSNFERGIFKLAIGIQAKLKVLVFMVLVCKSGNTFVRLREAISLSRRLINFFLLLGGKIANYANSIFPIFAMNRRTRCVN